MTNATIIEACRRAVEWRASIGPGAVSRLLDEIDRLRTEREAMRAELEETNRRLAGALWDSV